MGLLSDWPRLAVPQPSQGGNTYRDWPRYATIMGIAPRFTMGQVPLMPVWFTADTHFGHAGALALYRRPFASVADMNAAMIARWNETVAPDDDVWHLGDFALRTGADAAATLLRQLHGRKHLVTGNNDPPEITALPGWHSVQPYAEITVEGRRLVLCHYAFRTWNGMSKGALNLHGHSHGRLKPLPRQTDAGVDVWDFRPVGVDRMRGA